MIAKGFRPVGWVAAVGGAALGCYMISLNVAASRAEVGSLDRQIVQTERDIRSLETELGTRGRLSQLEHWNADVLALSAPNSKQFLSNEVQLARFETHEKTIAERAKVQLASVEVAPKPQPKIAPADYAAAAAANAAEPAPAPAMIHRASAQQPVTPALVHSASVEIAAAPVRPTPPAAHPIPAKKTVSLANGLAKEIDAAAKLEAGGGRAGR